MVRLQWDNETSPKYQQGVSHGVFYGEDGVGHAWSGLIGVTEKPQTNAPTPVYNAMGEKYDIFGNIAEKKHGLTCYTYPEEMDEYLGLEYLDTHGFTVDERSPKKFHMAYRTELGNGLYEIHVLLNQIATFGETARQTMSNSPALSTITMNLEGVPDSRLKSSHIILDSRLPITQSAEVLLFGDQYTDANIHDFLTAQPVWETVATNYAPIIEPDYDNYVWLGGENLVTDVVTSTPDSYLVYSFKTSNNPSTNDVLTFSLDATYPPDRAGIYLWYNDGTSNKLITRINASRGSSRHSVTFEYPEGPVVNFRVYSGSSNANFIATPGDTVLDKVKMEAGSVATPWTPAPSDPDQKPRPSDPYPDNYKPGVKRLSTSVNMPTRSATAYYDEITSGIGVYSNRGTHNTSSVFLYMYYISIGTVVDAYYKAHVRNIKGPTTGSYFGRMLLADRWEWGPIPNKPGTTAGSIKNHVFENNPRAVLWNGAPSGVAEVSFSDIMVTNAGTTSEFFDANSTPATRGDRYVRVPGTHFDYTIHQQLRLRSTSKVKLSDITQYDFWLEAADSMLLSQNETFTFNGPQAVIDGDTFTIDDSIQGYAEG